MKTFRLFALCGTLFFGAATGCGGVSAMDDSAITSVIGSDIAAGTLALAEGEERLADDSGMRQRPDCGRLAEVLGLSDEQVAQIQKYEQETRDALAALRQQVKDGSLSKEDAHAQGKALRDAEKANILGVLTAEQQAKFAELRSHHGRPFDLERLTKLLALDDAQVAQLKTIMSDTKTKVEDLRSQVESGAITQDEGRTQIKALLDAQLGAIKGVLTAEQIAKLEAAAPGGPERPRDGGGPGPGMGGAPRPGMGGPGPGRP